MRADEDAVTGRSAGRAKAKVVREPAAELPYARVVLAAESGVDRVVDYLVPVELDEAVRVGTRVRVRWEGDLTDAMVVDRAAASEFHDHFEWVQKTVSAVPAFTPELAELAGIVAEKYAGTTVEALRLVVPARVASAEKAAEQAGEQAEDGGRPTRRIDGSPWGPYGGGREFISALERKSGDRLPRALWTCLPGTDWITAVATALHAVASDVTYFPEPEVVEEAGEGQDGGSDPGSATGSLSGSSSGSLSGSAADAQSQLPPGGVPDDFDPDLYPDAGYDPDFDPELYYLDPDTDVMPPEVAAQIGLPTPAGSAASAAASAVPEIEPVHVAGRGTLAIVPDPRDLARLDRALTEIAGPGHHVVLSEDLPPAKRYQNWLAVLRGDVRIVIGTRAALWAPVQDLAFVVMWDDGDPRHADPRPPYPHVRDVLLLRAHQVGAGVLIGGFTCSAESAQLVAARWAVPLTAFRSTVLAKAPRVVVAPEGPAGEERDAGAVAARLPNAAWRTARAALTSGPVLVQVAERAVGGGAFAPLVCVRCGKHARCGFCHGPLSEITGPHAPNQEQRQSQNPSGGSHAQPMRQHRAEVRGDEVRGGESLGMRQRPDAAAGERQTDRRSAGQQRADIGGGEGQTRAGFGDGDRQASRSSAGQRRAESGDKEGSTRTEVVGGDRQAGSSSAGPQRADLTPDAIGGDSRAGVLPAGQQRPEVRAHVEDGGYRAGMRSAAQQHMDAGEGQAAPRSPEQQPAAARSDFPSPHSTAPNRSLPHPRPAASADSFASPQSPRHRVHCLWCTRPAEWWHCDGSRFGQSCDGDRFRPAAFSPAHTADELGEAFPHLLIVESTVAAPVAEVAGKPALVVAEPGAEPVAEGGYAAALLLDGQVLVAGRDLRAGAEALRHWLNAASLVRTSDEGGSVVIVADPANSAVHALEDWDPISFARREVELRDRLHHPPGARVAELVGSLRALHAELDILRLPRGAEVLGPAPLDPAGEQHRILIRVPRTVGAELTAALRDARELRESRTGRKADPATTVRVRIDPLGIG